MPAVIGLHEAAERCGVSDETIRRRIRDGSLPHAVRTSLHGGWQIPIADLVGAGLVVRRPGQTARPTRRDADESSANVLETVAALRAEVALLEAERTSHRLILETKDALIASLERHLSDLRQIITGGESQ